MVFIYKSKDLINIFENSTREDIGIALLAYEEFLSKGLKVSSKDLERLTKIFNYYDENFSDDYPSLTNESLQHCDNLIVNYFSDNNNIIKDDYKFKMNFADVYSDSTAIDVDVVDKFGRLETTLDYKVKHSSTNSNYDKDSFNTIYNACEKVQDQLKKTDIKSILNTYRL